MKTLSNDRGVALIILVIAMTLIAILGASFVALVGSKHKGFQYQRDSYRAINLANAGIEYATGYVGDSISLTPNTNDFCHSPTLYPNVPVTTTIPDTTNLSTTQWKKFDFPDSTGSFYLSYYLNPSYPNDVDTNKVLYSVGVSGSAQRVVRVRKFLSYASPSLTGLGRLNLVPSYHPYISGRYVVVPLINIYDSSLTVTSMNLELDSVDNSIKHLERIYFSSTSSSGSSIYEAIWYFYAYGFDDLCGFTSPPCYDYSNDIIQIPDTGATKTLNTTNIDIGGHYIRWFFFRFTESGTSLRGVYTITFSHSAGDTIIRFSL